ncbi:MAG: hypothetical protein V1901_03075 [Patescibacteria group bacterium]
MKNCPSCNSTRITQGEKGMHCLRCGYINNKDYLHEKIDSGEQIIREENQKPEDNTEIKKLLRKLSDDNSIRHKIFMWLGVHQDEILSQGDVARLLKLKRTCLNYHIIAFKRAGFIDRSLQLTKKGREIFFELWKAKGVPRLRIHNTQIKFYLSRCPVNYLERYKNKILKPLDNKRYKGFNFKIKDFSCTFYSRKTIVCYIKNIFAESPEETLSALQKIAEDIGQIIEKEFEGVEIGGFEMAKISFGHIALTNSFLAKKLDSLGYNYKGKAIDIDHSLSLDEAEITNFKKNNLQDIIALEKIDKDFQEFMERDQQAEQEQQDTQWFQST